MPQPASWGHKAGCLSSWASAHSSSQTSELSQKGLKAGTCTQKKTAASSSTAVTCCWDCCMQTGKAFAAKQLGCQTCFDLQAAKQTLPLEHLQHTPGLQCSNVTAHRPTVDFRQTPPQQELTGLELPSLEGIHLLLQHYPALGPALGALEWDHGRITKATLLNIMAALGADQDISTAETAGTQGDAAQATEQTRGAVLQSLAATCNKPPSAASTAEDLASPVQDTPKTGYASLKVGPTMAGVAATFAAAAAGSSATAAGNTSSAGSSRRTSLRPTLSIDISSLHVSDSSSDASSDAGSGPEAASTAAHQHGQNDEVPAATATATAAAAAGSTCYSEPQAYLGELCSAGDQHASTAVTRPLAATAEPGGSGLCMLPAKKKHCSTPGHVLHQPMHFYSNPVADGSSDEEDDYSNCRLAEYRGDESQEEEEEACGGAGAAWQAGGGVQEHRQQQLGRQPGSSTGGSRRRRAQTLGAGLGLPVSIFSADGSAASTHAPQQAAPEVNQQPECPVEHQHSSVRQARNQHCLPEQQEPGGRGHWHHKLLKRPPTPGFSLSRPVSIFSGSGSTAVLGEDTGLVHSHGEPPARGTKHDDEGSGHVQSNNSSRRSGSKAVVRPHSASGRTSKGRQQHVQWHHKLSKRPPTPGVSLAKPISIFSGSGCTDSQHNTYDGTDRLEDHSFDSSQQTLLSANEEQGVRFAEPVELLGSRSASGSSPDSQHHTGPSARQNAAVVAVAAQRGSAQAQDAAAWQHKLSKRPPTPGVSLCQPTSIFSTSGAAAGGRHSCEEGVHFGSEFTAEDDDSWGRVHFAANDSSAADTATARSTAGRCGASHPQSALCEVKPSLPQQPCHTSAGTDSASASNGGSVCSRSSVVSFRDLHPACRSGSSEVAGGIPAAPVQHTATTGGSRQHMQQQQHHKPSHRAPTPGGPLSKPVSVFSSNTGACGVVQAASQGAGENYTCCVQLPCRHAQPGHTAQADCSACSSHSSAPHRVSWNDAPELATHSSNDSELDGAVQNRPVHINAASSTSTSGHSHAHAAVGHSSSTSGSLSGSGEATQGHLTTWADDAGVPPAATAAAAGAATAAVGMSSEDTPAALKRQHVAGVARQDGSSTSHQPSGLLARLNPDLAAEAQQQQWQQHMSRRPPTPGAVLQPQHNVFTEDDSDDSGPRGTDGRTTGSTSSLAASAARKALLQQHPELAADVQQQQWQQHMSRRPPTPGAALQPERNVFAEDDDADSSWSPGSSPAGGAGSSQPGASGVCKALSDSSTSSGEGSALKLESAPKLALFKRHPRLSIEHDMQDGSKRPPTPSVAAPVNMFSDTCAGPVIPLAATNTSSSHWQLPAGQQVPSSVAVPAGGAAGALMLHNPDLALDKQQQWDMKLSKRPPTPATTLGKPFNMFPDDEQGDSTASPTSAISAVSSTVPAAPVSAAGSIAAPAGTSCGTLRSQSPDQARYPSSGSTNGSSSGSRSSRSASPSVSTGQGSSVSQPQAATTRHGSAAPGRQRGSSPLRSVTTPADVAAGYESGVNASRSPLRHSSSQSDPDPARMSPLGRCSSPAATSPSQMSGLAAPYSLNSQKASGLATVQVSKTTERAAGTGHSATQQVQPVELFSVESINDRNLGPHGQNVTEPQQQYSPSRLSRSASPEVGRDAGRAPSPLRRSSSSRDAGAVMPHRHGSPLSRCSSGGL